MREWLFVSWREPEFAASIELSLKPNIHDFVIPTVTGFPSIFWLQTSHAQFLSTNRVHFFANHLDDIFERAHTER